MDKPYSDAPILILGSGANIGLGLARRLVANGQKVILTYRSKPEPVINLQLENPELVIGAFAYDGKTASGLDRLFGKIAKVTDKIYGLINTIGPFIEKPVLKTTDEEFEEIVYGNLVLAFQTIKRVHPYMHKNGIGRIINFTFAGVEKAAAYDKIAPYAASKLALLALDNSLAKELIQDRITINSIAPGVTDTAPESHKDLAAKRSSRIVMVDDHFSAIDYLLSKKADNVSGTNITVSAGFGL